MSTTNPDRDNGHGDCSKALIQTETIPTDELPTVALSATVNVSDFAPPRRLYIKSLARETEQEFLESIGVDSDTYETVPYEWPHEIEEVAAEHVVDTSEMTASETAHVREMARKHADTFRRAVRNLRQKHVE